MSMEVIRTRRFVGVDVPLDGKHYVHCTFTGCVFTFDGGEWNIEDAFLIEGCSFKFSGSAARTLELLRRFGFISSHVTMPFKTE